MFKNIERFYRLSYFEKKLFFKAFYLLIKLRLLMIFTSFSYLTKSLEHLNYKSKIDKLELDEVRIVLTIKKSIFRAYRVIPWKSSCLVQSLTACNILQKYGLAGELYLGVMKDRERIKAHSWSICGDMIITGEKGYKAFKVISIFSWRRIDRY